MSVYWILCVAALLAANAQSTEDGAIEPACPPVCEIYCEHGNVLSNAGCPTCTCNDAVPKPLTTVAPPVWLPLCCPDGYTFGLPRGGSMKMCIGAGDGVTEPFACNKPDTSGPCKKCGQMCVVEGDMAGLCDLKGQCSFDYDAVKKSCPAEPACPPLCKIYCEHGNVLDDAGCPTCTCMKPEPKPPRTVAPRPVCPPVCAIYCEHGNVLDDAGCPTCTCTKPEPKPPRTVAPRPVCPPVCEIYCEHGNVLDDAGCPTCACKKPSIWTVQGSLVLDVADASCIVSNSTLHRVFAWSIAKIAGAGKSTVLIISVSALRRLSQFLTSSVAPRSLRQTQVLVTFLCKSTTQLQAKQMAQHLSIAAIGTINAAIDQEAAAAGQHHNIEVMSMEAHVVKVDPQSKTTGADSHTSVFVACVIATFGSLLVCAAAAFGLSVFYRRSSKSAAKVVVIQEVRLPAELDVVSGSEESNPNILAERVKNSNDEDMIDISTEASSRPSTSDLSIEA